ncbi:23204_t:CDS:2, partial [Gigaspora rosea]
PRTDGLSYEFYKLAKEEVLLILVKLFSMVLESKEMLCSWSQDIISLISKKKDNLEEITIEPLLKHLHKRVHSIKIKNQCFKIAAYADDLTIGIGSQSNWLKVLEIIRTYKAASNARVNRFKTMLIPLIVIAREHNLTSECNFRKVTKNELISTLGYK